MELNKLVKDAAQQLWIKKYAFLVLLYHRLQSSTSATKQRIHSAAVWTTVFLHKMISQ